MITPTLDYEIGRILAAIGPIALAAATVAPAALGVALAAAVTRRRGGLHPPAFAFPRARQATRVIGTSVDGRIPRPVALSVTASRQHLHVLGPTGTGKSTLLLNLVAQDIAAGR
ncbi:MAG TPA: hypothetical protein VEU77_08150, partial [Candidatus Acidoferrales bacterium]|nr:hypothetical protein [Candidatus Acidoferrales bacterium]